MRATQANKSNHQGLNRVGFLSNLPPSDAAAFEAIKITTTYPLGAVLFAEGEDSRGVFVLSSGRVKSSISSASGKVMILKIAQPGEVLGLHAVVSNSIFQATAQTIEPCRISFVRRDHFLCFLREHPQAALEAAEQLSASYQEACNQLRAIGLCDSARKKVARFVLEWAENNRQRPGGIRAKLTLTHEEIGQLISTSRETITRVLGEFKSRKWISFKNATLVIQNKRALQALLGYDSYSSSAFRSFPGEAVGAQQACVNPRNSIRLVQARL